MLTLFLSNNIHKTYQFIYLKELDMKNKQQLLKSLLSTFLMFLTFSGLQTNLIAGDTSTKTFQDEEGSSVQIDADGSKTIRKADGTTVQVKADGSKFIRNADGTTVQIDANGTKTIKKADGSSIQVKPAAK